MNKLKEIWDKLEEFHVETVFHSITREAVSMLSPMLDTNLHHTNVSYVSGQTIMKDFKDSFSDYHKEYLTTECQIMKQEKVSIGLIDILNDSELFLIYEPDLESIVDKRGNKLMGVTYTTFYGEEQERRHPVVSSIIVLSHSANYYRNSPYHVLKHEILHYIFQYLCYFHKEDGVTQLLTENGIYTEFLCDILPLIYAKTPDHKIKEYCKDSKYYKLLYNKLKKIM